MKLTEYDYKKFKQTVYLFIGNPIEIPKKWKNDKSRYRYLKAAMNIGLIYIYKEDNSRISSHLKSFLESNYRDFYEIIEKLQTSFFLLDGLKSKSIFNFFEENGLMEGENAVSIYFNDKVEQAPIGSICVLEIAQAGLAIFNKTANLEIEKLCKEFTKNNKIKYSELGEKIFPIHILLAYIENQKGLSTNMFKFINLDGSIDEIIPTDYFRETHSYYQRGDKESLIGLPLIEKFEQTMRRNFLSHLSFNDVHFSEKNQYGISQYRISLIGKKQQDELTHYLGVGETYLQAAERGISYGIGEVLRQSGDEFWISDLDEQRYHVRAMLHFVPMSAVNIYCLELRSQKIQSLKEQTEKLTGNEYHVIFHSVFNEAAGWIQIVNKRGKIVYKSNSSLDILEELSIGFNKILVDKINSHTNNNYGSVNVGDLEKKEITNFRELNITDFSNELRLLLGKRKIKESIWLYETAFDDIGLFVGKFTEEG